MRVVLDTNILIASAYAPRSASLRIVTACIEGRLTLVVSSAVRREYDRLLPRAVRLPRESARDREHAERMERLLSAAECVEPVETPRLVPDDPDDDKFLAAAEAGVASALITNDHHLLELESHSGCRIVRPSAFETLFGFAEQSADENRKE